jgi:hypothetical protein
MDGGWGSSGLVNQGSEFLLEEGESFPVGDGVAVYAEGGGCGGGGVAGDQEAGGAELVGGEGSLSGRRGWRMEDGGWRGRG